MGLRIFASADLHIGMKFARYDDEARALLVEARVKALGRIIDRANTASCDLFILAGDLFDRPNCPKALVLETLKQLNRFEGKLVVLLPGNHDYLQEGSENLWDLVSREAGDRVLVLGEPKPCDLAEFDMDAVLYPAPCTEKHSSQAATAWVRDEEKNPGRRYHIGIAHGSVEGVSPDFDGRYYPMKRKDLRDAGVTLWIVGHTHLPWTGDNICIPGTPEPDGFDCSHEGSALLIDLEDGEEPRIEQVSTGEFRFIDTDLDIRPESDPVREIGALLPSEPSRVLLRLTLRGLVPEEIREVLDEYLASLPATLFRLRLDTEGLAREITTDRIDGAFPAGSFPHLLLSDVRRENDPVLLNLAWTLIQEAAE